MAYLSFGNKELFEFVKSKDYLQRILDWKKCHTVRFHKKPFKIGTVCTLYWRVRVPIKKKKNIGFCPECEDWHFWKTEKQYDKLVDADHTFPFGRGPAHNLSNIIGKAVITKVYQLLFRKHNWLIEWGITYDGVNLKRMHINERVKFALEDGFDSIDNFEGYFSKHLKEGEYKTGIVYEYEKEEKA